MSEEKWIVKWPIDSEPYMTDCGWSEAQRDAKRFTSTEDGWRWLRERRFGLIVPRKRLYAFQARFVRLVPKVRK